MDHEIYKLYPYDERYMVSNLGNVKFIETGNIRKPSINPKSKYHIIVFSTKTKHVGRYVHKMVLETFVGDCPDDYDVSHLNGIRSDNRLSNLIYESRKNNFARRLEHNTDNNGSKNSQAKLTETNVLKIKKIPKSVPNELVGRIYNVSRTAIQRIRSGISWKYTH